MSDTMLLGVLRMPYDLAMMTELARAQYHSRGQEAAARIESDADTIESLRRERDEALRNEAAIRELMNCYNAGGWTDSIAVIRERDEARAEAEALRADAERYRWLRINGYVEVKCESPRHDDWSPVALDAAIDAAITEKG